mgnify:CR=1 FL=1
MTVGSAGAGDGLDGATVEGRVAAMAWLSASKVWVVVPLGTGTPRRRKDTALPICASATSKQRSSTRQAARCANSAKRTPATSISNMGPLRR